MYFEKIGELLYLRCPGPEGKTAGSPGILTLKGIKRYKEGWGIGGGGGQQQGQPHRPPNSQNPILRGIPATSARTSPPLVVTMGTSGV
jgi:hypothetical protein